jgi:hypothetical protein
MASEMERSRRRGMASKWKRHGGWNPTIRRRAQIPFPRRTAIPATKTHHASATHNDATTKAMTSKELGGFDGHGRAQIGAKQTKAECRNTPYPVHGSGLGQSCPRSGDLRSHHGRPSEQETPANATAGRWARARNGGRPSEIRAGRLGRARMAGPRHRTSVGEFPAARR